MGIGSAGDRTPAGFSSAYLSSKVAAAWFTESIRIEMARFGVKVTLIELGMFASGLLQRGASAGQSGLEMFDERLLSAYGPHEAMMQPIRETTQIAEQVNGGVEGMEKSVGGAVVEATSARWPRARHLVGVDANFLLWWLPYLPTWVADWEFSSRHEKVLAAYQGCNSLHSFTS